MVHLLTSTLPFAAHSAAFLHLDEAPSSHEDRTPTPYLECNGKSFGQQKGLEADLKIHKGRAIHGRLNIVGNTVNIGELSMHHNISHLHKRDFVCTRRGCDRSYGYKYRLLQHVSQAHKPMKRSNCSEGDNGKNVQFDLDGITGKSYLEGSAKIRRALLRPYPHFPPAFVPGQTGAVRSRFRDSLRICFERAYDLRRHLLSGHGLAVEKGLVVEWVEVDICGGSGRV